MESWQRREFSLGEVYGVQLGQVLMCLWKDECDFFGLGLLLWIGRE